MRNIQFQVPFPAVTVCNQNRVHCQKLRERKEFCEDCKNSLYLEKYNQTMSNQSTINNQTTNKCLETPETSAEYTICDKRTDENISVIEYLFHEGKCGEICLDGKIYCYCYLS